jgi:Ca-activated chloride channel homolog
MSFLWPSMLAGLIFVPVIVLLYLWLVQRRNRLTSRFGGLSVGNVSSNPAGGLRRHFPAALFLSGLTILIISLARPQAVISLPRVEGTVILLFDVSGSMAAEDIEPNRLEAAQAVAYEIIQNQPSTVQIGIVSFSNSGFSMQLPTHDQDAIFAAIERLKPQSSTALGQGILASLNAIAVNAGEAPLGISSQPDISQTEGGSEIELPEGDFSNSIIVLLSDGENHESSDPLLAAGSALERNVRIYSIGVGSIEGTPLEVDGFIVHTQLDEATLRSVSEITGGAYYHASDEADLETIYNDLTPQLVIKPESMEVTSVFAGASLLVLLVGSAFSMLWFRRAP